MVCCLFFGRHHRNALLLYHDPLWQVRQPIAPSKSRFDDPPPHFPAQASNETEGGEEQPEARSNHNIVHVIVCRPRARETASKCPTPTNVIEQEQTIRIVGESQKKRTTSTKRIYTRWGLVPETCVGISIVARKSGNNR